MAAMRISQNPPPGTESPFAGREASVLPADPALCTASIQPGAGKSSVVLAPVILTGDNAQDVSVVASPSADQTLVSPRLRAATPPTFRRHPKTTIDIRGRGVSLVQLHGYHTLLFYPLHPVAAGATMAGGRVPFSGSARRLANISRARIPHCQHES